MSTHGHGKKESYLKQMLAFYFAPLFRSFFTVLYLLFFLYFVVFYFDNILLAIKFLLYTLTISTLNLDISYLYWGSLFVISLIVPFSVSLYAIFIPFEIKKTRWTMAKKLLMVLLVIVGTMDVIFIMDKVIKVIKDQTPIVRFLEHEKNPRI